MKEKHGNEFRRTVWGNCDYTSPSSSLGIQVVPGSKPGSERLFWRGISQTLEANSMIVPQPRPPPFPSKVSQFATHRYRAMRHCIFRAY
jgi:hypothetical protein